MTYLLDANICIELMNDRSSSAARKLASIHPRDIHMCSVVKAELYHGAYKSGRDKNLALVRTFSAVFESLPFDDAAAEIYGRLRTHLEKQGKLIGPNDLLIASIALANNAILVTHNTEEFKRVPELNIEDWQG
ncbi:MAG: type II toxin-antitoxin system VapC family toxin [Chloroflexi bacterium]|nr:type II toxin-antitoxin system VapC family toxin [Chloroflexota bacterium]